MGRGDIEAYSLRAVIQAIGKTSTELKRGKFSVDQLKSIKMEIKLINKKIEQFRWLNGQEN